MLRIVALICLVGLAASHLSVDLGLGNGVKLNANVGGGSGAQVKANAQSDGACPMKQIGGLFGGLKNNLDVFGNTIQSGINSAVDMGKKMQSGIELEIGSAAAMGKQFYDEIRAKYADLTANIEKGSSDLKTLIQNKMNNISNMTKEQVKQVFNTVNEQVENIKSNLNKLCTELKAKHDKLETKGKAMLAEAETKVGAAKTALQKEGNELIANARAYQDQIVGAIKQNLDDGINAMVALAGQIQNCSEEVKAEIANVVVAKSNEFSQMVGEFQDKVKADLSSLKSQIADVQTQINDKDNASAELLALKEHLQAELNLKIGQVKAGCNEKLELLQKLAANLQDTSNGKIKADLQAALAGLNKLIDTIVNTKVNVGVTVESGKINAKVAVKV